MTRSIVDDDGTRRASKLNDGKLTVGSGGAAALRLSAASALEGAALDSCQALAVPERLRAPTRGLAADLLDRLTDQR